MDVKERQEIKNLNRHPWELSRCRVIRDILRPVIGKNCNILDIGCGDLFLEEYLSAFYPDCRFFCVDIAYTDRETEELNRKYPNVRVYNNLEAFAREKVEIDLVLLLDVVEHVEDDKGFLTELLSRSFIGKEAYLLITVPAFQCLYTSHDHFLGHYRRYNLRMLRKLWQGVNLENCCCGYFYSMLLLPRFLQRVKEKISGVNKETTGLVEWKGNRGITRLLCWMLTTDYKVGKLFSRMGLYLPGLSNYALCRKKPVL